MNHDELKDQLEAFALGALDPEERAAVAAHIVHCRECAGIVAAYENVIAALPRAADSVTAQPSIDAVRRRLGRSLRGRARRPRVAAIAVAVLAPLLVASVAWGLQADRAAAAQRLRLERLVRQQELVFEVVDAPHRSKVVLKSPVEGSTSYGKVFLRPDLPYVVAMVGRLPQPPAGTTYQLFLTLDTGETLRAGALVPNHEGFASLLFDARRNGPALDAARVIAEAPGATSPPGVPVLLWVAP